MRTHSGNTLNVRQIEKNPWKLVQLDENSELKSKLIKTIYLNGIEVGVHQGGYDAFSMDVTDCLVSGDTQELKVKVWNPSDKGTQPRGKHVTGPFGIWYTPVTGIWQSVWLEKVPKIRITNLKLTPDIDNPVLRAEIITEGETSGLIAELIAKAVGEIPGWEKIALAGKKCLKNHSLSHTVRETRGI